MYQFKIYKTNTCSVCKQLEAYIEEHLEGKYDLIETYYIDDPVLRFMLDEMREMGLKTVPQVWYSQSEVGPVTNWIHIGGFDKFKEWNELYSAMDAEQVADDE